MKVKQSLMRNPHIAALAECLDINDKVSAATRPIERTIYSIREWQRCFSTDGHSLTLSPIGSNSVKEGKCFNAEALATLGEWVAYDDKVEPMPEIGFLVDKEFPSMRLCLTVPKWFSELPRSCKAQAYFSSEGKISLHQSDDTVFSCDAGNLRNLAGDDVTIFYSNSKAPLVIVRGSVGEQLIKIYAFDQSVYIVMPMMLQSPAVSAVAS